MKKTSIILVSILLAVLFFACSCNVDAQEGIFSEISASVKDSGTQVKAYLGMDASYHYIQTDVGIEKIDSSSSSTLIKATADQQINQACLVDSNIYVLTSSTGTVGTSNILKYSLDGTKDSETKIEKVSWLTVNGAYYIDSTKTLGYVGSSSTSPTLSSSVLQCLESDKYIFLRLSDKYIVYDVTDLTTAKITLNIPDKLKNTDIKGFQLIDTATPSFLIVDDSGNIYSLTTSECKNLSKTIGATLPSGKIYSFLYTNGSDNYVVFKASSNFVRLSISSSGEYSMTSPYVVTGYSTTLRTSEVTNIIKSSTDGKFIIATFKNSVWEIDPKTGDATNIM